MQMESPNVFNKRRTTDSVGGRFIDTPMIKKRRLQHIIIATDIEFTIVNAQGRKVTLRVPNDTSLNEPRGMMVNATDACSKYIPPMPGFFQEFSKHYKMTPEMEFNLGLVGGATPIINFDNPGHTLMAMRGLCGVEICKAHTAYILALAFASCPPQHRETPEILKDPKRLVWIHAGICKVLGASYCATPIPVKAYPTTDHILILLELISAACPEMLKTRSISIEERTEMMAVLKLWHCPKYIRDISNESKRWSFDRPRERAEAINAALLASKEQRIVVVV